MLPQVEAPDVPPTPSVLHASQPAPPVPPTPPGVPSDPRVPAVPSAPFPALMSQFRIWTAELQPLMFTPTEFCPAAVPFPATIVNRSRIVVVEMPAAMTPMFVVLTMLDTF